MNVGTNKAIIGANREINNAAAASLINGLNFEFVSKSNNMILNVCAIYLFLFI